MPWPCKNGKAASPAPSLPTPASLKIASSGRAAQAYCAELMPPCEPLTARQPASAPGLSSVMESTTRSRGVTATTARCGRASIGVLARGLDDRAPLGDLGSHELLVSFGRHAIVVHHDGAQAFFLLDEVRVLQCRLQRRVEGLDHLGRRALGRVQAVPDRNVEALEA